MDWDVEALRRRFDRKEAQLRAYASQNRKRIAREDPRKDSANVEVDVASEKADLYRDLAASEALVSRERFLAELRRIRESDDSGEVCRRECDALIKEFSKE